jgi:hypothetical protein
MPGTHIRFCGRVLSFGCIVALVSGCQVATTEVSGAIKIKGQPPKMKGLQVCFLVEDGRMIFAAIDEQDGTYLAKGVPVGEAKVSFAYMPDIKQTGKPHLSRPNKDAPPPKGSGLVDSKNPIPGPLRDGSTSKLTFHVAAGEANVFNYDVRP